MQRSGPPFDFTALPKSITNFLKTKRRRPLRCEVTDVDDVADVTIEPKYHPTVISSNKNSFLLF